MEIFIALNNIHAVGHDHHGWGLEFRPDDADVVTPPKRPDGRSERLAAGGQSSVMLCTTRETMP